MPSWNAWVLRPSGLIKMCKEVQALKEDNIDLGRECFIEANIKNQ